MDKNKWFRFGQVLSFAFLLFSPALLAQINTWTWVGGNAYHANSPVYEKVNGGPEVSPGAREGSSATASNGKIYLFGGSTAKVGMNATYQEFAPPTCYRNDLWEYDPAANSWRFISGTRAAASWQDPQPRVGATLWVLGSKAYIFGGQVWDGQDYYFDKNDMWEYDLATGEQKKLFSYYSGSFPPGIVAPSSRSFANGWVYNNKLYLFGGSGNNDIWEYTPATNTWLQIRPNSAGMNAVYGTLRIPAAENTPGGRTKAAMTQVANKVFLFGGQGKTASGTATGALNDAWEYDAASGNWRWLAGSKVLNAPATYGTLEQPSSSNMPGGRNSAGCWWTNNKLWIGLGTGYDAQHNLGNLNDLWSLDTTTGQWCWQKGADTIEAAGMFGTLNNGNTKNTPGSKTMFAYATVNNQLMLFGGAGRDEQSNTGRMSDGWRYDAEANTWTWVSGHQNTLNDVYVAGHYGTRGVPAIGNYPGGREKAMTWSAYGKFYLFGGWGADAAGQTGWLNDLWEYDPVTKFWAWLSGPDTCNGMPIYGTRGVTSPLNVPGGRGHATAWGNRGVLYLMAGEGLDKKGQAGALNDCWGFDLSTRQWKWLKGSDTTNSPGHYGTKGVVSGTNEPRARMGASGWMHNNILYLFGGTPDNTQHLNDLWALDLRDIQWTWIHGSSVPDAASTGGSADPSSTPGAKSYANHWKLGNKFVVSGGMGTQINTNTYTADTWQFDPATRLWSMADNQSAFYRGNSASPAIMRIKAVNWSLADSSFLFGGEVRSWWVTCCEWFDRTGMFNLLEGIPLTGGINTTYYSTYYAGSTNIDAGATIGPINTVSAQFSPGARRNGAGWSLPGRLYLFGGYGMDASRMYGTLNDLWAYSLTNTVQPADASGSRNIDDIHSEPHISTTPYNIVATVMPSGTQPVSGSLTARLWVDAQEQRHNGLSYCRRHFEFQPAENAAAATATITLYFRQAEFDSYNQSGVSRLLPTSPTDLFGIASLRITRMSGTSSDGSGRVESYSGAEQVINPADDHITWNAAEGRWEISFETTGFSGFFLHTYETGLPISDIRLQGAGTAGGIALQWNSTSSEWGTQFVERSTNGSQFVQLATLPFVSATDSRNYSFLDAIETLPHSNRLWYRIRQQMASGNTQLSNIIMVKVPDDTRPIILLNNPVHDFASLQIRSAGSTTAAIRILDATGRVLMSKQQQVMTGLNTLRFETNALPNGVYYLQIRMGDNSHFITLLKQ